MENNKAVKKTGSAKLMHSIGFKVGIIISVLLLLILGIKATSDIIYSYTTTTKSNEENKLEETRRLARVLKYDLRLLIRQVAICRLYYRV